MGARDRLIWGELLMMARGYRRVILSRFKEGMTTGRHDKNSPVYNILLHAAWSFSNLRAHDQVKEEATQNCGLRARGQVMKHHDEVLLARRESVGAGTGRRVLLASWTALQIRPVLPKGWMICMRRWEMV